jgi:hypothetical protein
VTTEKPCDCLNAPLQERQARCRIGHYSKEKEGEKEGKQFFSYKLFA